MSNINESIVQQSFSSGLHRSGAQMSDAGYDAASLGGDSREYDSEAQGQQDPGFEIYATTSDVGAAPDNDAYSTGAGQEFDGDLMEGEFAPVPEKKRKPRLRMVAGALAGAVLVAGAAAAFHPEMRSKLQGKPELDLAAFNAAVAAKDGGASTPAAAPAITAAPVTPVEQDAKALVEKTATVAAAAATGSSPLVMAAAAPGQADPVAPASSSTSPATAASPQAMKIAPHKADANTEHTGKADQPEAVAAEVSATTTEKKPTPTAASQPKPKEVRSVAPTDAPSKPKVAMASPSGQRKTVVATPKAAPASVANSNPNAGAPLVVNDVKPLITVTANEIGLRSLTADTLVVANASSGSITRYRVGDYLPSGEKIRHIDSLALTIVTDKQIIRIVN